MTPSETAAFQRLVTKTARNCLVLRQNKLVLTRIPADNGPGRTFTFGGKELVQIDVAFKTRNNTLPICLEDTPENHGGIYLFIGTYPDDDGLH